MKTNNAEPDTEFYILQGTKKKKPLYKRPLFWIVLTVVLLCLSVVVFRVSQHHQKKNHPAQLIRMQYKEYDGLNYDIVDAEEVYAEYYEQAEIDEPMCLNKVNVGTREVNGFSLRIFTFTKGKLSLQLGPVDTDDSSIMLAVRAADISADNGRIEGTFVDNGKLLSQGGSRKGYCAIIRGKVYIGVAESTSYLEDALNNQGDFFRQHPLVVDGMAIDNKSNGKSLRRALCERGGEIFVVECANISFHDFAQALVEYGVENAIYLAGEDAYGFYRDTNNVRCDFGNPERNKEPNVTYIICR